jgi:hypothetical protein
MDEAPLSIFIGHTTLFYFHVLQKKRREHAVPVLPLGIIGNCLGAPGEKGRPADRAFKTNYKLYK